MPPLLPMLQHPLPIYHTPAAFPLPFPLSTTYPCHKQDDDSSDDGGDSDADAVRLQISCTARFPMHHTPFHHAPFLLPFHQQDGGSDHDSSDADEDGGLTLADKQRAVLVEIKALERALLKERQPRQSLRALPFPPPPPSQPPLPQLPSSTPIPPRPPETRMTPDTYSIPIVYIGARAR